MDVFELRNAITEIKNTMDGFKSKLDMAKQRFNELEYESDVDIPNIKYRSTERLVSENAEST